DLHVEPLGPHDPPLARAPRARLPADRARALALRAPLREDHATADAAHLAGPRARGTRTRRALHVARAPAHRTAVLADDVDTAPHGVEALLDGETGGLREVPAGGGSGPGRRGRAQDVAEDLVEAAPAEPHLGREIEAVEAHLGDAAGDGHGFPAVVG